MLLLKDVRFARMIETRERRVLIAEADGVIAGFLSFGKSFTRPLSCGEVMQLFVHPRHQRQGAGRALLAEAERLIFLELPEAHVWASRGSSSNAIYERAGWARTGQEKEIKSTMAAHVSLSVCVCVCVCACV